MNYIKYLQNAGTITYANESRMPGYSHRNWYGGLVSGINGSRYSVHPGVYNFYTNEDGSISWGKRTGHIVKGSDGKQYVDFEVDPNSTARPELKTYQRFELGLTTQKPQTPIVEQATEQEIIDPILRKVSTSVPIQNLASQENPQPIIQQQPVSKPITTKSNAANQEPPKPVAPKSNTIVKQPVPQNLLPYIANVTSDGVVFFNIPDGYTQNQFEEAMKAVFQQNKDLEQKPMVYYEQPKQQIQKQKQKQKAVQQSQEQYQKHKQQVLKYITGNNIQTVKVPVKKIGNPDLVTEVFVYPEKTVRAYNMHPEEYQKILEYLNKNYQKTKTNNKSDGYVLSLFGFDKVPIGGEVNDTLFYYINKDGKRKEVDKWYYNNPNIINENDPVSIKYIEKIDTNNGKSKMYSYSNGNEVYYKHNGYLVEHPFIWRISSDKPDTSIKSLNDTIPTLRKEGFTEQQIMDFVNKKKSLIDKSQNYNVDKSIFYPIEENQQTNNNLEQQVNNTDNSKQQTKKSDRIMKQVVKILNFLGFQNGGTLNYLNYIN